MINLQTRQQKLEEKTLKFSSEIIYLSRKLPINLENRIITKQLIRSASSIGANYAEANNAVSRANFKNKIYVCKKEAAETRYWLKLLAQSNNSTEIELLIDEVSQLLFIFQKITSTLSNQ